jgi:hypothetical protein
MFTAYYPFERTADIIDFSTCLDQKTIGNPPVVKEATVLLNLLTEFQPVKATAKGNLPQKIVREFCTRAELELFKRKAHSEMDIRTLTALRHVLTKCGWIKLRNKKFSLTKKGERLLKDGFTGEEFLHLLKKYKENLNWAFFDYYPELPIVQWSMLFSLYMLNQVADNYISEEKFAEYFIEAFPMALAECEDVHEYTTPKEELQSALTFRFLEKFCIYFGFLMSKREKSNSKIYKKELFIKISPLFKKFFKFPKTNISYLDEHLLKIKKDKLWN